MKDSLFALGLLLSPLRRTYLLVGSFFGLRFGKESDEVLEIQSHLHDGWPALVKVVFNI